MDKDTLKNYEKAKSISDGVVIFAKPMLKEGINIFDIGEKIENKIKELGGGIAFPVNISINENAAHYTPDIKDTIQLNNEDVVKIDIGVHVNGYIWDRAFTICIGQKTHPLIEAAETGLKEAMKIIKPGVKVLGNGKLTKKLNVKANQFSKTAKDAILKTGGTVEIIKRSKKKETSKVNNKT